MTGATSEPRFPSAKQKVTRPDAYFLVGALRPLDQAGGQVQNYQRSAISAIGPCNHVFMPRVCADAFRDCRNRFPSSQKDCERHERHQRRSALERSSRDPAWDVLRLDLPTKCSVAHAGGPEHQRPRGAICGRGLEGRLSRDQGPRLDLGHSPPSGPFLTLSNRSALGSLSALGRIFWRAAAPASASYTAGDSAAGDNPRAQKNPGQVSLTGVGIAGEIDC